MATSHSSSGRALADVLPPNVKLTSPHIVQLNVRIFIIILCGVCMGFDSAMMNGLQELETWRSYFDNPSSALLGVVNAVLNVAPLIVGGLPVVWFSDRFGRLRSVQLGCAILVFSSALQAGSRNLGMFAASRFLIGIGIELCIVCGPVLVTELAYPTQRSQATGMLMPFFYFGAIIASWTTYGTSHMMNTTWSWRIPSLLQALVPLIQLLTSFWLVESPRWLVSKGREAEARDILVRFHAGGDELSPLVAFEMEQIHEHILADAEVAHLKWSNLWNTAADRKRLILVIYIAFMSQMGGSALVSYYLTLILDTVGITTATTQTLINAIMSIINFLAAIFGASMIDRLGRRPLWLTAVGGMLITFVIWTALSALFAEHQHSQGLARGVLVFIFLFQALYSFGITPLQMSYCVEVLPFHARQKGMGAIYMCNSIALIYNNMVNPIAMKAISWKYYFVFIAILIQWVIVVYFFFPETRGRSLEEMAELFDGDVATTMITTSDDFEKACVEEMEGNKPVPCVAERVGKE